MATSELRKIHILANLTDEQLAALANFGEILPVAAGQKIISQGERADAMFMLISGRVAAFAKGFRKMASQMGQNDSECNVE